MSELSPSEAILTLEPFLEAVQDGLEQAGWERSGLQKTTSYEFEGRWAGDSSRSAYLFFHRPGVPEWVSIDAFLDETSRGLKGNLALVVDGPPLRKVPDPGPLLTSLAGMMERALPRGYRTPLTFRYRLSRPEDDVGLADTEARFKLHFPPSAMAAGAAAVSTLAKTIADAFLEILQDPELEGFEPAED